jgi:Family of unknown function (DUF5706)
MRLRLWTRQLKPMQVSLDSLQGDQEYEQYNAYSQLLDRNGQWIGVADTKVSVILGFLLATFPVLLAPALPVVQKALQAIARNTPFWMCLPAAGFIALVVLFLVSALATLVHVLMALTPRLAHQGEPGLIFFGDVASQEYQQWQRQMLALDPQRLALQVLEQVYVTACIAHCKHKHVRQAIRALIVTILLGLVLYILSQLAG